jgi:hypothetical protein
MLHEMMHATVMTYAQNGNRWIGDMAIQTPECHCKQDFRTSGIILNAYGPEACKILARTVKTFIAKDGITING